jgi:hypothetical protein
VLDEDEERVLHLPSREPDAAHDLRQRQRSVAEEAFAHLLREGDQAAGVRASHAGKEREGRRWIGGLTATRGPKWSEMRFTARRMPCCGTMVAGGEEDLVCRRFWV